MEEDASRTRAVSSHTAATCRVSTEILAGTRGSGSFCAQAEEGMFLKISSAKGTLVKFVEIGTFSQIMLFFPPLRGALNKKCPQKM